MTPAPRPTARTRITITDVAREAGVSKATVSFVLSGRPGPAEETRQRVLAVAERLGWRPSPQARGLSLSRTSAIGLVVTRDTEVFAFDPFFAQFVAGVEEVLARHDHALVLRIVAGDEGSEGGEGNEETAYRFLARQRADGVLLTDLRPRDPRYDLVAGLGLPAVAVGKPVGPCPVPSVHPEDNDAVEEALRHVADLGHRDIAHVSGPARYVHSVHRARAVDRAVRGLGLPGRQRLRGDFTTGSGQDVTSRLLNSARPPTAIVYDNDLMAAGGINAARAAGLSIPHDLSVLSLDRSPLGDVAYPPLTGVVTDVVAWGRRAADVLLRRIAGEPPTNEELAPLRLHTAGSTGPAPRR